MEKIGSLFENVVGRQKTKHEYEFQEICSEIEKDFGKLVWTLPHKKGVTEHKIKEAAKIARVRGIKTFPYLMGIINKL